MIDVSKFNSLIELLEAFPDEESCIVYLEKLRWRNGKVKSPFDKNRKSIIYLIIGICARILRKYSMLK